MLAAEFHAALVGDVEVARRGLHWVSGSGPGRKRIRLSRKTQDTSWDNQSVHGRPRVWKRLHCSGYTGVPRVDCKRRRCSQHELEDRPVDPRTGVG